MLNELFKKESLSIFTFKKGDLIIRTERVIRKIKSYNENLGIEIVTLQQDRDESFMTTPLEFICIENEVIYCRMIREQWVIKLLLENYQDGWAQFKIPEGLTLQDCI